MKNKPITNQNGETVIVKQIASKFEYDTTSIISPARAKVNQDCSGCKHRNDMNHKACFEDDGCVFTVTCSDGYVCTGSHAKIDANLHRLEMNGRL